MVTCNRSCVVKVNLQWARIRRCNRMQMFDYGIVSCEIFLGTLFAAIHLNVSIYVHMWYAATSIDDQVERFEKGLVE